MTMILASCSTEIQLHNCDTVKLVQVYRNTDSPIQTMSWSNNGFFLAAVPVRGHTQILQTRGGLTVHSTLDELPQINTAVFQRANKKSLGVATEQGDVLVYDVDSGTASKPFVTDGSSINLMDWSARDTYLAISGPEGPVKVYNNDSGHKISELRVPASKSVSAICFHSIHQPYIGGASDEGHVTMWDIHEREDIYFLPSHRGIVTDLTFSARSANMFVSVALDRQINVYDTNVSETAIAIPTKEPLSAVDIAPDGINIAAASINGSILLYDLRYPNKSTMCFNSHLGHIYPVIFKRLKNCLFESIPLEELPGCELYMPESNPIFKPHVSHFEPSSVAANACNTSVLGKSHMDMPNTSKIRSSKMPHAPRAQENVTNVDHNKSPNIPQEDDSSWKCAEDLPFKSSSNTPSRTKTNVSNIPRPCRPHNVKKLACKRQNNRPSSDEEKFIDDMRSPSNSEVPKNQSISAEETFSYNIRPCSSFKEEKTCPSTSQQQLHNHTSMSDNDDVENSKWLVSVITPPDYASPVVSQEESNQELSAPQKNVLSISNLPLPACPQQENTDQMIKNIVTDIVLSQTSKIFDFINEESINLQINISYLFAKQEDNVKKLLCSMQSHPSEEDIVKRIAELKVANSNLRFILDKATASQHSQNLH